jgi:hypothetical protein
VADGVNGGFAYPLNHPAILSEAVLKILAGDEVTAEGAAVEAEGGNLLAA